MIRLGCCLPGGSFMPQGENDVPRSASDVLLEGSRIVEEAGYDYTETSAGFICQLSDAEVDRLEEARLQGKLHLEACNSFIPGALPITDDHKREELRRYVEKVISRAARLGIDVVVFGSGGARRRPEEMSMEAWRERTHSFLRMCNTFGAQYGVTIVIEPLNQRECNVLNTVAEGAEMVRALGLSHIRLLADAYHMYCEAEELSVLHSERDILRHIHVAETPARVYPGRDGGEYLSQFAQALTKAGYDGRISVECGFQDFKSEILAAHAFLKGVF